MNTVVMASENLFPLVQVICLLLGLTCLASGLQVDLGTSNQTGVAPSEVAPSPTTGDETKSGSVNAAAVRPVDSRALQNAMKDNIAPLVPIPPVKAAVNPASSGSPAVPPVSGGADSKSRAGQSPVASSAPQASSAPPSTADLSASKSNDKPGDLASGKRRATRDEGTPAAKFGQADALQPNFAQVQLRESVDMPNPSWFLGLIVLVVALAPARRLYIWMQTKSFAWFPEVHPKKRYCFSCPQSCCFDPSYTLHFFCNVD